MMSISFLHQSAWPAVLLLSALMLGWIVATPFLAAANDPLAPALYQTGAYICHQKISRSFCLFTQPSLRVGDCTVQDGSFRNDLRSEWCANGESDVRHDCAGLAGYGYKFPVSARDIAIYAGFFFSTLLFPLFRSIYSRRVPHWGWLALAIAPMALDGTTQLFGWRESSNTLRAFTGLVAGGAMAFYFIVMLNRVVAPKRSEREKAESKNQPPFSMAEGGKSEKNEIQNSSSSNSLSNILSASLRRWAPALIILGLAALVYLLMQLWMHPQVFGG